MPLFLSAMNHKNKYYAQITAKSRQAMHVKLLFSPNANSAL